MSIVSRFAPSPTGYLHLGHAYSAWLGRTQSQIWRLRFEDIDATRCKPEYLSAIQQDLSWLGLTWDGEIRVQSEHLAEYRGVLETLTRKELLYPCFCTRGEIARAQSAPHFRETIYPGTCRNLSPAERDRKLHAGIPFALRMNVERACQMAGTRRFFEIGTGWAEAEPRRWGDVIIARKETPTSYHLCVVHDDWAQQISHVIRGEDLRDATHIHVLLQAILGYETPCYRHHKLIVGDDGKRLAKRDKAATLRELRDMGITPDEIIRRLAATQAAYS
ncbi:MAG: tRNA glutamyl-Q(34) synthetase GluQRS [Rhodospirillales bacterium]|nr:tRNA glutamyl-Q(34) synthetase GluQRS [Rhodospirillales bacterium]MDE2459245.1 tRNA glutamyl-Q(34) synthetase GluQRS [Rhodospirillales bacterium]